ncbi:MAG: MFS transporter [Vibrio sp.]
MESAKSNLIEESNNKRALKVKNKALLIIGVLFIAGNLRATVSGVAPMLGEISNSFTLSSIEAGMLTTLPLIAFALFAPPSAYFAKRFGLEYTIFGALLLIAIGVVCRSYGLVGSLFLGTILIGIGVSIGNVLLPIIVKRDFPMKVAVMTSSYVLAMGAASSLTSVFSIPLAKFHQLGWQVALSAIVILTVLAMLIWLPQLKYNSKPTVLATDVTSTNLWANKLAWQISIYLGFGSFFTYIIMAWLPTINVLAGYTEAEAGVIHGVFQIGTALPGIFLIPLMAKLDDQRIPAFGICLVAGICCVGILKLPEYSYFWSLMLGVASGAWFILGISFISLRTSNSLQATSLSGMAQFIGYSCAAVGPMLGGYINELTQSWDNVMFMIAFISLFTAVIGLFVGRNQKIQ